MSASIYPPLESLIVHQMRATKSAEKLLPEMAGSGAISNQTAQSHVDHMQGILASLEELQELRTIIKNLNGADPKTGQTAMPAASSSEDA